MSLLEGFGSAHSAPAYNSKTVKLREILADYFQSTTEQFDSRVIIFVALRNTVHQVIDEINSVAGIIVGLVLHYE